MGNSTSRVVGCFAPSRNAKDAVNLDFLEPLDEGLGHSFCYITPSTSARYTVDSGALECDTRSGSFKTISGASVSANASTARTPDVLFTNDAQEPAASFESTASFAAVPLQPGPRGSGPLNGFMSGPLERGFMSGPLDGSDPSNFSAPLDYCRKRARFGWSWGPQWMRRLFLSRAEAEGKCVEYGSCVEDHSATRNLQWAHGKAGEDRVHVVLSEEHGWLYVGIYDGFSGPDATEFLMSNLYKAVDKELEGLLWENEDEPQRSGHPETDVCENTVDREQMVSENNEDCGEKMMATDVSGDISSTSQVNSGDKGRKSKRLYELLQMELLSDCEAKASSELSSCMKGETSGRVERTDSLRSEGEYDTSSRQMLRDKKLGLKLRNIYRKQKTLRKRLLSWKYDWHRDQHMEERIVHEPIITRRFKSGPVDHEAVLQAMTRGLEATEEAYMDMMERLIDSNPELALMGSCVLVMLMKDQDVYVMNLGDSRVVLAQDRLNDRHVNSSLAEDDKIHRNKSLVRVELDRISEESPIHNPNSHICTINKHKEISLCRLNIRPIQLSTDHNTNIEEEVLRIKSEHSDDAQAVINERVKGQLKVTRAFGAGFLKKPKFNEALLEMFQINYIGSKPYLSCMPSVLHHRLCSNDRFLVLASDGLYEYFSNEDVVSHVAWFMENVPDGDPAQYLISELLFRAAKKNGMDFHELLDIPHGDRRKYHDDVSVMVVSLEGRIWKSAG